MNHNQDTQPNYPLAEFYKELEDHDWFYMMTKKVRAYNKGKKNERLLEAKAKELGKEYTKLLNDYRDYKWSIHTNKLLDRPEPPEGYNDLIFKKHTDSVF